MFYWEVDSCLGMNEFCAIELEGYLQTPLGAHIQL